MDEDTDLVKFLHDNKIHYQKAVANALLPRGNRLDAGKPLTELSTDKVLHRIWIIN